MVVISLLLLTLWLTSMVVGFTLGGLIHLLAISAIAIVFLSGNGMTRRA